MSVYTTQPQCYICFIPIPLQLLVFVRQIQCESPKGSVLGGGQLYIIISVSVYMTDLAGYHACMTGRGIVHKTTYRGPVITGYWF